MGKPYWPRIIYHGIDKCHRVPPRTNVTTHWQSLSNLQQCRDDRWRPQESSHWYRLGHVPQGIKNMYTRFLGFRCCDIFKNLLNLYVNITTVDLESNNQWMNYTIDASLKIDKHFEHVKDCIQYTDDVNTLYTTAQMLQKAHHAVMAPVVCMDACEEWIKNREKTKRDQVQDFLWTNITISRSPRSWLRGRWDIVAQTLCYRWKIYPPKLKNLKWLQLPTKGMLNRWWQQYTR